MAYRQPSSRLPKTVEFTVEEVTFLNSIRPWTKDKWSDSLGTALENKKRNEIKDKIKSQLKDIQDNYCAFCGLNLDLAHQVHREHIAPQYKHSDYIFEPGNLVLTCNFCNMHKMKKLTVSSATNDYDTETFKILHPHRDDFNKHLSCDFNKNELVFKILGPKLDKTKETIKCVGLAEPHLMSQRGAIILKSALPTSSMLDWLVKQIIAYNRKRK
jgi:uncharacterized protein (TIGR02646 family)